MPADTNTVVLLCRLTKDPEVRHTQSGTAVASLRVAWTTRAKRGEAWEDRSNFGDVVVWGRMAETVAEHCRRGRQIAVTGRLEWREWQDPAGGTRQALEVIAQAIQFLGDPAGRGGGQAGVPTAQATTTQAAGGHDDSDIPF